MKKSLVLVLTFILIALQAFCDTIDNDTTLEFYWGTATGSVAKYNVYLSTNGSEYVLVGETFNAPTESSPYAVPLVAVDGSAYQLKVEAVDAEGLAGPMSEPSDQVLCKLPGEYLYKKLIAIPDLRSNN